jgi:GcrA cell cycle regulator
MTEWSSEMIVRLRNLWCEGHSTAEIGRRLHISKNAVVGKAHRLHLPSRPSPIRRESSGSTQREQRAESPRRARPARAGALLEASKAAPATMDVVFAALTPAAVPRLAPTYGAMREGGSWNDDHLSKSPCCWPIGEPTKPSFSFCCADSVVGKPYCPDHCGIAYRPRRRGTQGSLVATAIDESKRTTMEGAA